MALNMEAMNTRFYVDLFPNESTDWQDSFITWIRYVEKEWSRFLPNNELALINEAKQGIALSVSEPLFDVLFLADYFYHKTKGLFSPYLLHVIEAHGYNRSFPFKQSNREMEIVPIVEENPLIFNKEEGVFTKNTQQKIDLGGIAKGYSVDSAAIWLRDEIGAEGGIVDGGGDMFLWSNGNKEWRIGITDPFNEEKQLTTIQINNGAIATSNKIYRSWMQEGEKKHHLLNGRSGKPANTEVVQATAIAKTCTEADIAAKMACIIEEDVREQWLSENFPDVSFFFVKTDRSLEMLRDGKVNKNVG